MTDSMIVALMVFMLAITVQHIRLRMSAQRILRDHEHEIDKLRVRISRLEWRHGEGKAHHDE